MTKDGCEEPCQKPHESPVVRRHTDHHINSVKSLIVMVVSWVSQLLGAKALVVVCTKFYAFL